MHTQTDLAQDRTSLSVANSISSNSSKAIQFGGKKKKKKKDDDWRTGSLDKEFDTVKSDPKKNQLHGLTVDTGHHKMAKSKLKKVYPHLDAGDRKDLGVEGKKGLQSLRSNLTLGTNSAHRSEDPGDKFDGNFEASGALTPRSKHLKKADEEFDKGELSGMTGGIGAGLGIAGGLTLAGAGIGAAAKITGATLMATAGAPLALTALGVGAIGGGLLGYMMGSKKEKTSKQSKDAIVGHIKSAEKAHRKKGLTDKLDTDLSMWEPSGGGKVKKRTGSPKKESKKNK